MAGTFYDTNKIFKTVQQRYLALPTEYLQAGTGTNR